MRSSKKKRSKSTIAVLIGAIIVVQIAIFFVIRDPDPDKEAAQESAESISAADTQAAAAPTLGDTATDAEVSATEPTTVPTTTAPLEPVIEEPPRPEPVEVAKVETQPAPVETKAPPPPKTKVVASRGNKTKRGRNIGKPEPKPTPPKVVPAPAPVKAAPSMASVTILTSPSGATVALDGVFVGKSPLRNIDVAPGRHSVALSYSGFDPKVVRLRAVAGESERISETLSKIVVRKKAPEPAAPTAVVATRRPATPRIASSREGSAATGKGLLASGCNSCHRKNGTSAIGPRRFTSTQWDRFFSRGSHDRYQRIGGAMSGGQMAHVKTYLKSKAADAARNQGAGIR